MEDKQTNVYDDDNIPEVDLPKDTTSDNMTDESTTTGNDVKKGKASRK